MKNFKTIVMLVMVGFIFINCGNDAIDCLGGTSGKASFDGKIKALQSRERLLHDSSFSERIEGETLSEDEAMDLVSYILYRKVYWVADKDGDYWSTSKEFEDNNLRGDCEDIQWWEYIQLRKSGEFSDDDMSLRIVKNYYSDDDGFHVILAVQTTGRTIIVDNGSIYTEEEEHTKIHTEFDYWNLW